ncbi:MAG: hypothetical protein HDR72_06995 [Ruminococcaceae bacterium]|nr:hypothetical protein [Oscillospiraceae bacterium]
MIVNRTVFSQKDIEFSMKYSRKEKRISFSMLFVLLCGIVLLVLGGITLYKGLSSGEGVNVGIVILAFVMGVLFILWCIFFNKLSAARALKLPSLKAPRTYEFSDEGVRCRLSLNGVESDERYSYSIMEKYFEENDAIYIRITIDNRQRFFALHNDSYSEGSPEELKALLESHGVHK